MAVRYSASLNAAFRRALDGAQARGHAELAGEHILLELLRERDALKVLLGCRIACERLRAEITDYLDNALPAATEKRRRKPSVSKRAERLIQCACIRVSMKGGNTVTGSDLLRSLCTAKELPAAVLLRSHGLTSFDLIEYLSFGIIPPHNARRSVA